MLTNAFSTPIALALTEIFTAPAGETCFLDVTATISSADVTSAKDTISIAVKLTDGTYKYLERDRELTRGISFSFEKIILVEGQSLAVMASTGVSDFSVFVSKAPAITGAPA